MSPRSQELIDEAKGRLRVATKLLELEEWTVAASTAYYAMLYAARAALSERDLYAKTHSGTWNLFHTEIAEAGSFDRTLADSARASQNVRELSDYEAKPPSPEQARELVALAGRFLAAVTELIGE